MRQPEGFPAGAALAVLALVWGAAAESAARAGQPREIAVTASKYAFEPARIEVTQGETVRLVVQSADSTHGFGIKKLKIAREVARRGGEPTIIEFVATQLGEFEIRCTEWCGKGHKSMKGLLVVAPRVGSR